MHHEHRIQLADAMLLVEPVAGVVWAVGTQNETTLLGGAPSGEVRPVVQIADTRVGDRRVYIVTPGKPLDDRAVRVAVLDLLSEHAGLADAAFLTSDGHGQATLVNQSRAPDETIAAAGAVVRASWAWDESPAIRVTVNEAIFVVEVAWDGEAWRTSVRAAP